MHLNKLTTRYSAQEDRMLLSAEGDRGILNLWLTHRLIKGLLPHLLGWLESRTEVEPLSTETDRQLQSLASGAGRQGADNAAPHLAQLIAQTRHAPKQVDASQATRSVLIQTIHFQPRDTQLRLVFELPDEEAVLVLQPEHLRIWLSAMYTAWQQADWSDVWPEWMKQAGRMRSQYPVSRMH